MPHFPSWTRKLPKTDLDRINLKKGITKISSSLAERKAPAPNCSYSTPSKTKIDYNTFTNPKSINFETYKGYLPQLK